MIGQFADRVFAVADKLDAASKSAKVPYPNGDQYEGQTYGPGSHVRHGHGTYHYAAGQARYEGEFVDDDKHGRGSLFFEDGDAYDGQWCGNRQHGRGVLVHWSPQHGVWVYEGEFRAGLRDGAGALVARGRGALCGSWAAGSLRRGVELRTGGPGGIHVAIVGEVPADEAHASTCGAPSLEEADGPRRTLLGPSPREWRPAEVRLWLWGLGLEASPDRPPLVINGSQLLAEDDPELVASQCQLSAGTSEAAQAWRLALRAAHEALRAAAEEAAAQLGNWEELQTALPSVRKRFVPSSELGLPTSQGAPSTRSMLSAEWRGLQVEVSPLALRLATTHGTAGGAQLPFAAARGWARDLEALATLRHPNIRPLLGLTLVQPDPSESVAAVALVFEGSRASSLLFEWIHASLPDGSRRPLDIRTELRICMGLCDALAALSSRGLVFGALCSVNVELIQASGGVLARLTRAGSSWWRWGWKEALSVREAGQPRRRALTVEEVVRRYAGCPVNWQAPEVLRGRDPTDAADTYAFGLVLWEMLYRAIPFGDFSIAQIISAVGYGRRTLRATASPGASTETTYLHEVLSRCAHWDPTSRPPASVLLDSLRDVARAYEQKRAQRSVLGKLGDKTEALLSSALFSQGLQRSLYGADVRGGGDSASPAETSDEPRRVVRLATGEWVRVDGDLLEQFPGDEEKWRTLMAFRSRLKPGEH